MIFDDHDIRDDWNTSARWRQEMEQTDWWHGRIVAGLASYWVYQHLGNMTAKERAEDEIWQRVFGRRRRRATRPLRGAGQLRRTGRQGAGDLPLELLPEITGAAWSSSTRAPPGSSRRTSARCSTTARWRGSDELTGDCDHLFMGTSLPFLMPPGPPAPRGVQRGPRRRCVRSGAEGGSGEHAPRRRPRALGRLPGGVPGGRRDGVQVASGHRGRPPRTVTFLSGDVHHSYVSQVTRLHRRDRRERQSRVLQAVCSPIRNPLPQGMRFPTAALAYGLAGALGAMSARPSGPGPAVPLGQPPGSVVRQQPRDPRRHGQGTGALVGQGRCPQEKAASAARTNGRDSPRWADVHIDNPARAGPRATTRRSPPAARWARRGVAASRARRATRRTSSRCAE